MIFDKESLFSNNQAVTATAASENVIDLGADNALVNSPNEKDVEVFCQVTTAFTTLTDLTVSLQSDNDVAFGSPTTLLTTAAIGVATLVAGYKFAIGMLPKNLTERYIRLYYTVGGSNAVAGKIMAGLVLDVQTGV